MSLGHGTSIVRSNLFLHLDAANIKSYPGSGTTWFDLSGNANHGTIVNSPTYNGASFTFNNASSHSVNIPYKSQWRLIGSNSISYWSDGSNSSQVAVGYQKGSWEGYTVGPTAVAYSAIAGGNDNGAAALSKNAGEWCLFTWVVNRSTNLYTLYKNGTLVSTASITHPDLSSVFTNGVLSIGSSAGVAGRFYTGSISNVMFYTKALSTAEVGQNFDALRGRYGI
jgi:hypothetical protein